MRILTINSNYMRNANTQKKQRKIYRLKQTNKHFQKAFVERFKCWNVSWEVNCKRWENGMGSQAGTNDSRVYAWQIDVVMMWSSRRDTHIEAAGATTVTFSGTIYDWSVYNIQIVYINTTFIFRYLSVLCIVWFALLCF